MTKEQQQAIIRLKNGGLSLSQISTRLGISRSTVKSFCQRLQAATQTTTETKGTCEQCGLPLRFREGRAHPRFCSDKCRTAWWNTHPEQLSPSAMVEVRCVCCGTAFRSFPSRHRSYCSRQCYIRARYGGTRHAE